MTIWITQQQYDAVMESISKIPVPDDLREIQLLVPPLATWNIHKEPLSNQRLVRKLQTVLFMPVLRDPDQSRDEPPEMIWKMFTDVHICDEWLAEEMQSVIIQQ